MPQPPLFDRVSIFDVMASRQNLLREDFKRLPESALKDAQLPRKLANDYDIVVPVLVDDQMQATTREVDMDVSQDRMRQIWDRSKPFYVRGTEITIHIPFQGEPALFDVRPQQFKMNPPHGGFDELELRIAWTMIEPRDISPEIERKIAEVRQHLDWLRPSVGELKTKLEQLAESLIADRNRRRAANEQIVGSLGIPIRQTEVFPPKRPDSDAVGARRIGPAKRESKAQWDFFISHASEDKEEIARPLADALVAKGFRVWYDDFSLKVGDTLLESIDRGLADSRFGIVILSPRFFEKHWPKQELSGLATREVNGKKVLLPVWHKVNVDEVRNYSPTLAGRVGALTAKGLDHVILKLLEAIE